MLLQIILYTGKVSKASRGFCSPQADSSGTVFDTLVKMTSSKMINLFADMPSIMSIGHSNLFGKV